VSECVCVCKRYALSFTVLITRTYTHHTTPHTQHVSYLHATLLDEEEEELDEDDERERKGLDEGEEEQDPLVPRTNEKLMEFFTRTKQHWVRVYTCMCLSYKHTLFPVPAILYCTLNPPHSSQTNQKTKQTTPNKSAQTHSTLRGLCSLLRLNSYSVLQCTAPPLHYHCTTLHYTAPPLHYTILHCTPPHTPTHSRVTVGGVTLSTVHTIRTIHFMTIN
jgi:hypothetical protein